MPTCHTLGINHPQDAKLKYSDIDEVILVGGSTRIPAVVVRARAGDDRRCCLGCNGGAEEGVRARAASWSCLLCVWCRSACPCTAAGLSFCHFTDCVHATVCLLQELVEKISHKAPNVTVNPDEVSAPHECSMEEQPAAA